MWTLHAAETMATWVQTAQLVPVIVQCPAPASEPALKWWLQSVVPVAGGTLIAVLTSIYSRRLEQKQWARNQQASHNQWIRDQKKREWRELLDAVNECQDYLPSISQPRGDAKYTDDDLPSLNRARKLQQILEDRLFIDESVIEPIRSDWVHISQQAKDTSENMSKYTLSYGTFVEKVRKLARRDLAVD